MNKIEKGKNIVICPSILAADFANLKDEVLSIKEADWIHFDVMDGHFVPNLSFGTIIADAIRPYTKLPLDVHLMISNPDQYIDQFAKAGAAMITIHQEVAIHGHRTLQKIKASGALAGMALNPGTPIETLHEYLPYLDLILIMTVNPGFGGQSFIESMPDKIQRTKEMIDQSGYQIYLEVDGGISAKNIERIASSGANAFVAGSAIFSKADREQEIKTMRNLAEKGFKNHEY